jgi:hypothetical protein
VFGGRQIGVVERDRFACSRRDCETLRGLESSAKQVIRLIRGGGTVRFGRRLGADACMATPLASCAAVSRAEVRDMTKQTPVQSCIMKRL